MIHLSRLARILGLFALILGVGVALTACAAPGASSRLAEPQRLPGMPYVPAGTAQEIAKQAAQPTQAAAQPAQAAAQPAAAQPAAAQPAAAKPATSGSQASVSTQAGVAQPFNAQSAHAHRPPHPGTDPTTAAVRPNRRPPPGQAAVARFGRRRHRPTVSTP
ncbi:MAG: hypothetical protein KIS91_07095 [Anaerolineae bacterium]|nr:hypothetical protein [Anaerolineae bacterium]